MAVIGCPESPQNQSEEAFLVALKKSSSVAGAIVWPGMENTIRAYEELAAARHAARLRGPRTAHPRFRPIWWRPTTVAPPGAPSSI